ncbi:zf-HC2 domain-containing protein [Promicromonospora panici]|uniref:zf-HC2 domain-containing protein n=1 Tax=Promicromonospora panici TaxID=2219658 RepID=UPI00101C83C3|nr:zf-HC2 domain-containing protein [Promicromonospora panici]
MTATDDLRFDDLRAVFDGEDEDDISMLRFLLPDPRATDAVGDDVPDGVGDIEGVGVVHEVECRLTRAAMHDYVNRNLQPRRQRRLETHLYGCDRCIRAFIDIREVSWKRRAAGLTTPIGRSIGTSNGTDDDAPRLKGTS